MNRTEEREAILLALYTIDITGQAIDKVFDDLLTIIEKPEFTPYVIETVNEVVERREALDEIINRNLTNYTLDRLSFIDQQILRFATYELLFKKEEIHPTVVINEGIQLCKKFSDLDDGKASKFINRVLDEINKDLNG